MEKKVNVITVLQYCKLPLMYNLCASNISDVSVEYLPTLPVQKYTQNLTSQNYFNKKGTKKSNQWN